MSLPSVDSNLKLLLVVVFFLALPLPQKPLPCVEYFLLKNNQDLGICSDLVLRIYCRVLSISVLISYY